MWTEEEVAEMLKGDLDPGIKAALAGAIGAKVMPAPGPGDVVVAVRQSEATHQVKVINLLHKYGWLVHAERPAWSKKGWSTPIQGDPGWFDIAAIHPVKHEVLLLELKTDSGKLSAFQEKWIMAANQCPGVKVLIVRPQDMAEFEERIR